eukprot:3932731-Rhodomonas_salina.1
MELIKNVGQRILKTWGDPSADATSGGTEEFCKRVEEASGAARVLAEARQCQIRTCGTQSAAACAKASLLERIRQRREQWRARDRGKAHCDTVLFAAGLQVFNVAASADRGRGPANPQLSSLDLVFRAEGNGQSKGRTPLRSEDVSIFLRDAKVAVKPNHNWPVDLVEECLRELKLKHRFTVKRSGCEVHVSTSAEGSGGADAACTGTGLMEQLRQEDVFATTSIDRDHVVLHHPAWEAWWSALCREALHERPFWKAFYRNV